MSPILDNKREAKLAAICLTATLLILAGLYHSLAIHGYIAYIEGDKRFVFESILFGVAMLFVAYGNVLYQVCLMGHYKRRDAHIPTDRQTLYSLYKHNAPSLSVLVPSYKEERTVIWQTLMSAALAEYPRKNVVLLIDDPYRPNALADIVKLEDTRRIPQELQALFGEPAKLYLSEQQAFNHRVHSSGLYWEQELARLSGHYDQVADWLDNVANDFIGTQTLASMPYADRFFVEAILQAPARQHTALANELRKMVETGDAPTEEFIERHYARLVGLFSIEFTSFERKKYSNLSHEANKAMNLNSYMGIIGKSWKEIEVEKGRWHLVETAPEQADFTIPDADYIDTIDADSMMLSDYALRLIHIMEQPGNHKLAVIQSPCSSFPGCPKGLERTAGACIDVQFLTHQGYTYWGASFWVGANAMLRRRALEEIKEVRPDGVTIYIQDRTVIEDTESTIDLVHKGWRLYNYPERMTFSATPPDFGSLLIQRRRWSNGGLLILPKLFNYAKNAPKNLNLAKELFMRFHYLASTTTGCVVALLFFLYPFGNVFSSAWLPLSVVPFFTLFLRDLKNAGYRYSDALRICAMNLMLLPIVTGGVLKSFQQMLTGKKIPFGRTPKITGRTAAPALYCLIAVLMPLVFIGTALHQIAIHHWAQSVFAFVNAGFLSYALIHFIGVKAAFEDIFADVKTRWKTAFHTAEIIPILGGEKGVMPLPVLSKQA